MLNIQLLLEPQFCVKSKLKIKWLYDLLQYTVTQTSGMAIKVPSECGLSQLSGTWLSKHFYSNQELG